MVHEIKPKNELFEVTNEADLFDFALEAEQDPEEEDQEPPHKVSKFHKTKSKRAKKKVKKENLETSETQPNQNESSEALEDQLGDCQCYYCGEMIATKEIQLHMKSQHGRFHRKMFGEPRPLQCSVCRATFEKQSALTTHSCYTNFIPTKVRGGDPYKCDICNKTFTGKSSTLIRVLLYVDVTWG